MATRTEEEHEMYKALSLGSALAAKRVNEAVRQLKENPESAHRDSWQREIETAQAASKWCFVEQMRIDPD